MGRDNVRVIPVFVEGAEMPAPADLPDALVPLTRRNGVSLSDTKWGSDIAVLINAIDRVVTDKPPARGSKPERARPHQSEHNQPMGMGTSIVLIAVGALLKFAVTATVSGIELATFGTVLIVVGIIGLLISRPWRSSPTATPLSRGA